MSLRHVNVNSYVTLTAAKISDRDNVEMSLVDADI